MLKRILFLLVVTLFISTSLFAGTTGKLAGRVTDEDGKPIEFAAIMIIGEQIGTETNANGVYTIINIPPGIYDVACMLSGYQQTKATNVKINLDLTTMQNFTLSKNIIELEGFTVTENAIEMVQATKTNSGRTISTDDMEDVAVDDLEGVIAFQAGVVETNGELHIRGGRSNEVAYTVDGMSVSDPVDGGSALTVDMDAVEVTDVKTGGFTAEYGNAQSGIVNIITRSGQEYYSGKIEASSDHLLPGTLHSNADETKFAFGGPVIPFGGENLSKKFTFFFNGVGSWSDSRYWKHYKNDPGDELKYLSQDAFEVNDPYADREDFIGFDTGNRNYNDYNANIKVKYDFSPTSNITFAARGDKAVYDPFSYNWKYAMEHYQHYESMQNQFVATYDHTFNSSTNLKIKASYYTKEVNRSPIGIDLEDFFVRNDGAFDPFAENARYDCSGISYLTEEDGLLGAESIYDWSIFTSTGVEEQISEYTNFVRPGSIYGFFQDDENNILTLRSDFEYQLNQIHGLKTGFELIKHYIKKNQVLSPWRVDETRYQEYLSDSDPVYWFYDFSDLTDDEIDDFVTDYNLAQKPNSDNIYYNAEQGAQPNTEVLDDYFTINTYNLDDYYNATIFASGETDGYEANPYQAAYYLQDKMEWEGMIVNAGVRLDFWYLGEKYKIIKNGGIERWEEFEEDEKFQMLISPRLGVSHPISETAVLHFAYNYQNQLPQMQYIFTTYTEQDAITSNTAVTVGKPSLEPQVTVTYEVGLQKQLSEDYVMDINAYFKNIYNYPSLVEKESDVDDNVTWLEWDSQDYGSARGIDINLEKRLSSFIMGSTSYSLAWAFGNNSDDVIQTATTDLREFPLDWDMRHNYSFNLTFRVQKGEEFYIPFTDIAMPQFITDDFSTNFNYNIASGTPYTPSTEDGTAMETNSELKPFYEKARLKFTKKIKFSDKVYLRAYFDIDNLFNRRNVITVYPITGSPYYDGTDISDNSGYTAEEVSYIHDLYTNNPSNVSQGRTYTFGISFHF